MSQNYTVNFNQLVVYGYIRSAQQVLESLLIPNEIYLTCYQYYYTPITIFLLEINENGQRFSTFDIDNKTLSSSMNLNKLKNHALSSFCYIPNISHSLSKSIKGINTKTLYDAIFCYSTKLKDKYKSKILFPAIPGRAAISSIHSKHEKYDIYPCLLLFSTNAVRNKFKYELKSKSKVTASPQSTVFCGDTNGIIYESNTKLYQLKLQNIKSKTKLLFKNIKTNDDYKINKLWKYDNNKKKSNIQTFLNLTYIPNTNHLFAVENYYLKFVGGPAIANPTMRKYSVKCGVFNFDNNEWNAVKPYTYEKRVLDATKFDCKTCYDDLNDVIYMVTLLGDTAQFNFRKNKWKTLYSEKEMLKENGITSSFGSSQSILWTDDRNPNVLYSLYKITSIDMKENGLDQDTQQNKVVYQYFDVREKVPKWNICDINMQLTMKNQFITFS